MGFVNLRAEINRGLIFIHMYILAEVIFPSMQNSHTGKFRVTSRCAVLTLVPSTQCRVMRRSIGVGGGVKVVGLW